MDSIAVGGFDRLKYQAIMWVRAKLYERPAGMLLKEGVLPPSIHGINSLFAGRPVSVFLPYEAYTADGLFKVVTGREKGVNKAIYSFGLALGTSKRLTSIEAGALQELILQSLPEHYVLQCISARLPGEEEGYTSLLCITAPVGEARESVKEVRFAYQTAIESLGLSVEVLTPDGLLVFIRRAFDAVNDGDAYSDNDTIKNQAGRAGVELSADRMRLSNDEGVFRELILFSGRRFGRDSYFPLSTIFPRLINSTHHIASVCALRKGGGFVGNFCIAEVVEPGRPATLEALFSSAGWLVEQNRYNGHMAFLSLLPMGVNQGLASLMLSQRRWRPFSHEQLSVILPLPYQSNIAVVSPSSRNVVRLGEGAHV